MDERYEKSIHRIGRIGILIGLAFMLESGCDLRGLQRVAGEHRPRIRSSRGPAGCVYPHQHRGGVRLHAHAGFFRLHHLPHRKRDQLEIPVVVNAQTLTETAQGTDEGDTVATIGVAVSSFVTTLIIIAGVILLVPLQPILTTPAIQTATTYMLPALFGGLFLSYVNDDCGEYVAKNKSLTLIVPMAVVLIVNLFYPLSGKRDLPSSAVWC